MSPFIIFNSISTLTEKSAEIAANLNSDNRATIQEGDQWTIKLKVGLQFPFYHFQFVYFC